jgi:hypothetical protein
MQSPSRFSAARFSEPKAAVVRFRYPKRSPELPYLRGVRRWISIDRSQPGWKTSATRR